ncbi:F-box protein At3g07870-like [Rhododendron vialii]|uniref:F-box protein At3g07870-like n=1 Tax=Rhododendron vialii TaxID=182163 RepID=UPI00265E2860|nr:F-box protein At3g07870-like [Rhododendron vialii]
MEDQKLSIAEIKMAIETLSEDLLMEILWRLPVKSLLQSKSVCKNWYALIQNPSFISLHHHRAASIAAAQNTDCLLVKRALDGGNGKIILSLIPNETPTEDIDISFTGLDIEKLQLLGPCNGVVCLIRLALNSTIVICNPSMREFRVLPQPSHKKGYMANLGFGFDHYTNDYKVVRFGYLDPEFKTCWLDERIEIYELSTDCWREVDAASPVEYGFECTYSSCVSWNGDFFWYAFCHGGDAAIIVFSMTNEVFNELPLPEVCLLDNSGARELFILNDSLALALYPSTWVPPLWAVKLSFEKCFDIWVMDVHGVEVSWTKKISIGPLQKPNFALGFRKNGEFLLECGDGQMMSDNIDTRQIKEYQVYSHSPPCCLQVLPHTESLVSVKRHNEHDETDDLHV